MSARTPLLEATAALRRRSPIVRGSACRPKSWLLLPKRGAEEAGESAAAALQPPPNARHTVIKAGCPRSTAMARLALFILLPPLAEAAWPSCTRVNVAPDTAFGIGGKHDPYDDGAEACWVLASPARA